MKKTFLCTLTLIIGFSATVYGQSHHYYNNFLITQSNPSAGSSTVVDLIKTPPEIAYFENQSDISLFNFWTSDIFSTYTAGLYGSGVSGGAADILGIASTNSLAFGADGGAEMLLSSFNGTGHVFDPVFSNYYALVFDIANIGLYDVDVLFRIGPNSSSALYSSFDEFFTPIAQNIVSISAGDTATFIFYLGLAVSDPSIVWDYANDPYTDIYLNFQPAVGAESFSVLVDNIGVAAVPEPGAVMLCLFGFIVSKFVWRKNK